MFKAMVFESKSQTAQNTSQKKTTGIMASSGSFRFSRKSRSQSFPVFNSEDLPSGAAKEEMTSKHSRKNSATFSSISEDSTKSRSSSPPATSLIPISILDEDVKPTPSRRACRDLQKDSRSSSLRSTSLSKTKFTDVPRPSMTQDTSTVKFHGDSNRDQKRRSNQDAHYVTKVGQGTSWSHFLLRYSTFLLWHKHMLLGD
ncbi:unnamed protein product [Clavelina lepadiformis]|uniref:Uncharacterized protein n=1 Tax=Clavelina lepadiformis TaxID=159417 RepID=A0ABP0G3H1_CLALP